MPRTARASVGGICYHVINRGNAKMQVFHKEADYEAFVGLIGRACERVEMRVLAYCVMPNHFHLSLWPLCDMDLSRWMQWLLTAHVRRYHSHYGTSGHVWQGRFKAFPNQSDAHLITVLRYVERNPVRAGLATRAQDWRWSSAGGWTRGNRPDFLHPGPAIRPDDWLKYVNESQSQEELEALRRSVNRGAPFGDEGWVRRTCKRLALEFTIRPRGRP